VREEAPRVPADIQSELESLRSEVRRLTGSLEIVRAELELAKAEIARKDRIIAGLQHRLFGASSEKIDPNQLNFPFDPAAMGKPAPAAAEDDKPKRRAESTRRTKAERFPKNLKIVIDEVIVPEEVAADPDAYEKIGEEYSDELDVIRPEIFWRRKVREKFVPKADRSAPPIIAPAPLPSIPGTMVAPDLAAMIIVDKFVDHLPHYRQGLRFRRRHGADIGRQTINTWTHLFAAFLTIIGKAILHSLRNATVLQIDETTTDYLDPGHGRVRTGYLWVYHNPATGECYYDWHDGRSHKCMFEVLGYDPVSHTIGSSLTIQCDGYAAYTALAKRFDGVSLAGCLAHVRRGFVEVGADAPEATLPILRGIEEIYFIEKQARLCGAPPACLELIRRSRSLPIAGELHGMMLEAARTTLPKQALGEALTYALGQWDKITAILRRGDLPLDNNAVENLVRPVKVGHSNWLFFGSFEAGANNALLYTLMANCKKQDIDPEAYLVEVFRRLPHAATLAQAAKLPPAAIAAEWRAKAIDAEEVA
jgi:transposase